MVDPERYAAAFEQQSFPGDRLAADSAYDPTGRKLHAFSLIRRLEMRSIDLILLPCFISQTYLSEIAPKIGTPIFGLMDTLRAKLAADHPGARRIGAARRGLRAARAGRAATLISGSMEIGPAPLTRRQPSAMQRDTF